MRNIKKQLWVGVCLSVAAALTLAGCSGNGEMPNESTEPTSGNVEPSGENEAPGDDSALTGEITYWLPTQSESQQAALDLVVDGFAAKYPGASVAVEQRSGDAHKEAIRLSSGTDSAPDVYWYWSGPGLGGELVDVGASADLTEYYEQYGWEDRFTATSLSPSTRYGGYHGVPWGQQGTAVYYNKALFAEAGIEEPPATYTELIEAADALTAAGITPVAFGGTVNWHVMRLLDFLIETECGADTHRALAGLSESWDHSCLTDAYSELKSWGDSYFNEGYLSMNNDDATQLFFNGTSAMAFEGTGFSTSLADADIDIDNIGIFAFPTGTDRLNGRGDALYISASSDNKDLAAAFADFATSTEIQEQTVGAWGALSVNKDVDPPEGNPLIDLWSDILQGGGEVYGPADQDFPAEITSEFWRVQNAVLTGAITPADAGATFQAFVDSTS